MLACAHSGAHAWRVCGVRMASSYLEPNTESRLHGGQWLYAQRTAASILLTAPSNCICHSIWCSIYLLKILSVS